jgi:hypothetical protein
LLPYSPRHDKNQIRRRLGRLRREVGSAGGTAGNGALEL